MQFSPIAWAPEKYPKLEGVFAVNEDLARADLWPSSAGPEDVVVDSNGFVFTGVTSGDINRFRPDGSNVQTIANTGGRPMGLELSPEGGLVVCDAFKGLLHMSAGGDIRPLVDQFEGKDLLLTNNAAIASDGRIFFSDSSQRWNLDNFTADLLEQRATGRLLVLHPNGVVEELVSDLAFANGVVLAPDESFVLVAETGRFAIHRYWLKGPNAGTQDVWLSNLPGFPDNLSQHEGVIWCAIARPRDAMLDMLQSKPLLKSLVMKLPESLQPAPSRHGFVIGFDVDGNVTHNLQDASGSVAATTGVRAAHGKLYIGSISEPTLAVLEL